MIENLIFSDQTGHFCGYSKADGHTAISSSRPVTCYDKLPSFHLIPGGFASGKRAISPAHASCFMARLASRQEARYRPKRWRPVEKHPVARMSGYKSLLRFGSAAATSPPESGVPPRSGCCPLPPNRSGVATCGQLVVLPAAEPAIRVSWLPLPGPASFAKFFSTPPRDVHRNQDAQRKAGKEDTPLAALLPHPVTNA